MQPQEMQWQASGDSENQGIRGESIGNWGVHPDTTAPFSVRLMHSGGLEKARQKLVARVCPSLSFNAVVVHWWQMKAADEADEADEADGGVSSLGRERTTSRIDVLKVEGL